MQVKEKQITPASSSSISSFISTSVDISAKGSRGQNDNSEYMTRIFQDFYSRVLLSPCSKERAVHATQVLSSAVNNNSARQVKQAMAQMNNNSTAQPECMEIVFLFNSNNYSSTKSPTKNCFFVDFETWN